MKNFIGEYNLPRIVSSAAAAFCAGYVFLHWQNYGLRVTRYIYESEKLPDRFDGFRIVQISDYHNTSVLKDKVVGYAAAEGPDIIVITGDLIDCRRTDIRAGLELVRSLSRLCPVYFVSGNHEARMTDYIRFARELEDSGAVNMENRCLPLFKDGESINLLGARDPWFYGDEKREENKTFKEIFARSIRRLCDEAQGFKLLLSHRPEYIRQYAESGVDLALTGHAHGGQFGIPFTDMGVLVPNQGFFPPYAAGMKKLDGTTEIISRGIGNSVFPFRLANRPELVTVELKRV